MRTLITNCAENTHTELPKDLQSLADIPKNLLRVSVGLEDEEDLIADLDQAFTKVLGG